MIGAAIIQPFMATIRLVDVETAAAMSMQDFSGVLPESDTEPHEYEILSRVHVEWDNDIFDATVSHCVKGRYLIWYDGNTYEWVSHDRILCAPSPHDAKALRGASIHGMHAP